MTNDNTRTLMEMYDKQLAELDTAALVYIAANRIYPHKDNPRKDLGDLSELADSIKAKGILQNLTVVPWALANPEASAEDLATHKDDYTAVIGHRRHSAAVLAGLSSVPCVISHMTYDEQLATMVMENMQRSDLTPYEQAKSFQLMMDLGESVESLAEKTGFSKTTVRRRLKMAELDEKTMQKVSSRQISIMDFDKLSEIEDIDKRNQLLKDIGTNNFENRVQNAIKEQTTEKNRRLVLKELERRNIKDSSMMNKASRKYLFAVNASTYTRLDSDLAPGVEYFYEHSWADSYYIYKEAGAEKTPEEIEMEEKAKEEARIRGLFNDMTERAYNLRFSFIKKFPKTEVKKYIPEITEFILRDQWDVRAFHSYASNKFMELLGVKDRVGEKTYSMIEGKVSPCPEYALLVHAYALFDDRANRGCHSYYFKYQKSFDLERLYDFLAKIGYEISDEERQMLDGTHPLYIKEE